MSQIYFLSDLFITTFYINCYFDNYNNTLVKMLEGISSFYSFCDVTFLPLELGITHGKDGCYKITLPFRTKPKVPSNKTTAINRLMSLTNMLLENRIGKSVYMAFMNDLLFRMGMLNLFPKAKFTRWLQ